MHPGQKPVRTERLGGLDIGALLPAFIGNLYRKSDTSDMHIIVRYTLLAVIVTVVSSCACSEFEETPQERLVMEALRRFEEWHQSGQLPGFAKHERGSVMTGAIHEKRKVAYPMTVVLHVSPRTQASHYVYTLAKDSAKSPWRLDGALRVGNDGLQADLLLE